VIDRVTARTRAAAALVAAARVALGVLWLREGLLKYRAGFGRADVLLVVDSASTNTRVPGWFTPFTDGVLGRWPTAFGAAIPLLEVALGIGLLLGTLRLPDLWRRPLALASLVVLATYWSADQLIDAYPAMALLAAVLLAVPTTRQPAGSAAGAGPSR